MQSTPHTIFNHTMMALSGHIFNAWRNWPGFDVLLHVSFNARSLSKAISDETLRDVDVHVTSRVVQVQVKAATPRPAEKSGRMKNE